jgi:FkbM family methyltransferase
MRKIIAQFIGRKFPYFKGKQKLIRALYTPDRNLNSGDEFTIKYFDKKYHGITSNYIDWGVYFFGGLEKGLINYFDTVIDQYDYFIDIGSNSGTISLPFANYKNLQIICFEPLDYSYQKLIKNFRINNALKKNTFHKIALSNKKGFGYLYYSLTESNIGTATLQQDRDKIKSVKERVLIDKLDNICKFKNSKIIIKIDVEGHEDKLIDGATKLLKNNQILMYLETFNKKLLKKLRKKGFKCFYPKFIEEKFSFQKKQYFHHTILKNH